MTPESAPVWPMIRIKLLVTGEGERQNIVSLTGRRAEGEAMEIDEIRSEIRLGEDSRRQFKANVSNPEQVASEIVAFLNSSGGRIFVGVGDDGSLSALTAEDIRRINQLLSNAATHDVRPPAVVRTQNVLIDDKIVMVIEIAEGLNKPYCDNEGRFWVKNGSDKRKVTSPEELQRLFQAGSKLFADERAIPDTSIEDLDMSAFADFYRRKTGAGLDAAEIPTGRILESLGLMKRGSITLAGLLLVGKDVSLHAPLFHIAAAAFPGADLAEDAFVDKTELRGRLPDQFAGAMSFLDRNLRYVQANPSGGFNQSGTLEIPRDALQEVMVNALVHRDYLINASIKLFVFSDRVEIQSPGTLPNSLTVEAAKMGVSVARNSILMSHAQYLVPYSGLGTGLPRSLARCPDLELANDEKAMRFVVRFPRR